MRRLRSSVARLVGLFTAGRRERDMAAELEAHLALHIDDNIRAGMSPAEARRQARLFITAQLMTITLPYGLRLHLGQDLNVPYPADLQHLVNPDLRALLAQIDPTPDSPHGSGAVDWADLADRIHYIADLFRCYADSVDLFEPPFTPEQIARLKLGHLPAGTL